MTREKLNKIINAILSLRESATDEVALDAIDIYPAWKTGVAYNADERVSYNDVLYKCLQSHESQETWNPIDAASLWARVLIPDPETVPEWIQPDSTNPYMKGDKVTHNEKIWVSNVDNNVWEPGVYGWDEVNE